METKIISYTLYGNETRYTHPLLENSCIYKTLFASWKMRVYHDDSVDQEYLRQLKQNDVELLKIETDESKIYSPKAWRFLAVKDQTSDVVIFRDADSLLTTREAQLVEKWLDSDCQAHIIRDHPLHVAPILAGLFGIKKPFFQLLSENLKHFAAYEKKHPYNYDQIVLADYIYPRVVAKALIHSSYFTFRDEIAVRIEQPRDGLNFMGAIATSTEREISEHRALIDSKSYVTGIPYSWAKLLRYKVRPTLYLSNSLAKLNCLFGGDYSNANKTP